MRSLAIQSPGRAGLRTIQRQYFALHDIRLGLGDLDEGLRRNAEGLRKHRRIVAAHPVADTERAMLRVEPVVESKDGVTGRRTERLDRVAVAFWKIPEIAG